jgi:RHS repeat-associated protein
VLTTSDYDISESDPGYGDLMGLSASISGQPVFSTSYSHDDLGRITSLTESVQGTASTRRFEYDDAGRLTTVRDENDAVLASYAYDDNGNRSRVTRGGSTTLASCLGGGVANQLDQLCLYGEFSYAYDANGALQTKSGPEGDTGYVYDAVGKLKTVTLPSGDRIDYLHDVSGRRVGKVKNGQFVAGWLYADGLRPIAQLGADRALVSTFVYGTRLNVPDYIVRNVGTSKVTYRVIADHLGTPRVVVNAASGEVVYRLDVDEFGNVLRESGDLTLLPFGFAGGLYDRDTRLVRFGARDYDAFTGRWTARDPILFGGGQTNLYAYVDNDPVNYVDPEGASLRRVLIVGEQLFEAGLVGLRKAFSAMRSADGVRASSLKEAEDFARKYSTESGGPGGFDIDPGHKLPSGSRGEPHLHGIGPGGERLPGHVWWDKAGVFLVSMADANGDGVLDDLDVATMCDPFGTTYSREWH